MKLVLDRIESRTSAYDELPLFRYMRDTSIDARERLGFAPCLAHFVMTFADLYAYVLRVEPAADRFQELVNAHTYEDGGHWKWFLSDLAKLGQDPAFRFSDALRFVWGDSTVASRLLAYEICKLGLGASSLRKLVLVHCIEATGKVSLRAAAPIGRELGARLGVKLLYLGSHHFDTESEHTLEDDSIRRSLDEIVLDADTRDELLGIVDKTFDRFVEFSAELLKFAEARRSSGDKWW